MKKNIFISILLIIILLLILFIVSDKRIVLHNDTYNTKAEYNTSLSTTANTTTIQSEITETATEITTSLYTIVIDPGHQEKGNSEKEPIAPGASETKAKVSYGTSGVISGIPEYEINLQISLKLKEELIKRGYNVIMTRETNNVNISNAERANIANDINADAFIRIHCNGSTDSNANGILTMCQTSDNPYCGNIYEKSRSLSENILSNLCSKTGARNRGVIETDSMSGINWCQIPVTIVETGFLTNPNEDKLLNDLSYQYKISEGIACGIDNYLNR